MSLQKNETPRGQTSGLSSNQTNQEAETLSQKSGPVKRLVPNFDQAEQFTTRLNGGKSNGKFTFLAIDDDKTRNSPPSPEKHGTIEEAANFIKNATMRGYGVYVTVNVTDLKGRKTENILSARAIFVDLDGAPIVPVLNCEMPPDIVVESSRGKYHAYWLNDGSITLDNFTSVQKLLIAKFGGDRCVHDLPRIMRLPGSWHQKVSKDGVRSEPFMTRVCEGGAT
jgi:putative DNA primase/helicase